jgi:hypothetical protein
MHESKYYLMIIIADINKKMSIPKVLGYLVGIKRSIFNLKMSKIL